MAKQFMAAYRKRLIVNVDTLDIENNNFYVNRLSTIEDIDIIESSLKLLFLKLRKEIIDNKIKFHE